MKEIVLIGGAPTTGKSTLAKQLSEKLGIPWISTDQVREIMLATVRKEDYPEIFHSKGCSAEEYLTKFSADEIVANEIREGEETWKGVQALIKHAYPWKGFIIEGVGILPHLVHALEEKNIRPLFLIDENEKEVRKVVFERGLWADAKTYSDDVKEKEVEWVTLFSKKLREEAKEFNYPVIEVCKNEEDLEKALQVLCA